MYLRGIMVSKTQLLFLLALTLSLFIFNGCEDSTDPEEIESVVGSWGTGYFADSDTYSSVTFYPNNYFIFWMSDEAGSPSDSGGGVEIGTYNYDAENQSMTANCLIDENGEHGLASNGITGSIELFVQNDTLYAYEDGQMNVQTTRVFSSTNPLVGGWGLGRYTEGSRQYISLTFYENGIYIIWAADNPYQPQEHDGAEVGYYSYNQQTNELTLNGCILDENADGGIYVNGEEGDYGSGITMTVENDTLTIFIDGEIDWTGPRVAD